MALPNDRRRKSVDAFRTISEASEEVGVSATVLRFWETKFLQIKPLRRGGKRRFYRPEDIALLQRIRGWLHDDGYSIKGVQKLLQENCDRQSTRQNEDAEHADVVSWKSSGELPQPVASVGSLDLQLLGLAGDEIDVAKATAGSEGVDQDPVSGVDEGTGNSDAEGIMDTNPDLSQDDPAQGLRGSAEHAEPDQGSVGDLIDHVSLTERPVRDFDDSKLADLRNMIGSLEEIRDRLRGPPPGA